MSEPDKQPEKVEPTLDKETPSTEPAHTDETVVPAAANNNDAAKDNAVTPPAVELPAKKEPAVSVTPSPVAAPATEVPPANDNASEPPAAAITEAAPEAAPAASPEAAPETAPAATETAPAQPSKAKGFLKKAFNFAVKMGAGAAVTATFKTAAVVGASIAGAPAWATIVGSGLAVGLGSMLFQDAWERGKLKKQGVELAPYFSKAHGKQLLSKKSLTNFGVSTVAAIAGSMLYLGFHEGIIQNWWNHLTGQTPAVAPVAPAVVAPVTPAVAPHVVAQPAVVPAPHVVAPVAPVHCATPMEQFGDLVKGHHVSHGVQQALHRAASTNPRVHAQGLKDLAYYAQNGFGGVPKNHNVALELFKQAADSGNVQSKVDMLYLQHWGLDGVSGNKAASLATMHDIHTAKATEFVKAWGGAGKNLPHVKFDTGTILKGMKVGCPA